MSNYTKKPALISMLLAWYDLANTHDAIRPHGELPACAAIIPAKVESVRELSAATVAILGRAVATQRGSHYARTAAGTLDRGQRRLAHRYTGSEMWLLTGAGTVGLRSLTGTEALRERRAIMQHQRRLVAESNTSVRAMMSLRLLLLWHATETTASIFSRDGNHIIAPPVCSKPLTPTQAIHTNADFDF